MSIKYERLVALKRFPRKLLVGITELEYNKLIENFCKNYVQNSVGYKPSTNIFENVIFDTRVGPFDLYCYGGGLESGFIVSNRLLTILREYNLQEHKIFPEIRYTFKGKEKDDMNFLVLYKDYEQFIDYEKSTFIKVKYNYLEFKDGRRNLNEEAILKDNLKFKSKEEFFEAKKRDILSKDPKVVFKNVFCPECVQLDMFFFNKYLTGVYLSPRLVKRMADEKIKGIHYWGNFTYEFTG